MICDWRRRLDRWGRWKFGGRDFYDGRRMLDHRGRGGFSRSGWGIYDRRRRLDHRGRGGFGGRGLSSCLSRLILVDRRGGPASRYRRQGRQVRVFGQSGQRGFERLPVPFRLDVGRVCLRGLGSRGPVQRALDGYSPAGGAEGAYEGEEQYGATSHKQEPCKRVQRGSFTYSAATDTSSPLSSLPATDGVASMSSVQTTISAAISEDASDDEGLAGLER